MKKLKHLALFDPGRIDVKGNRVAPNDDYVEFKKEEIRQSIPACFEKRALVRPDHIAVKTGHESITYACLNHYANHIAQGIAAAGGNAYNRAVALLFAHGSDMISGIFGVLKSGSIYVPLDPKYPVERLEYMLHDSAARLIVTHNEYYDLAQKLKERARRPMQIINIDNFTTHDSAASPAPGTVIHPDQAAYVLYTSGSTGKPKGVVQTHRNILHFARVYTNNLHIHAGDRLTLFSSYCFDAAQMDIFGALLNGAVLYPCDVRRESTLAHLPHWLQQEKITIYHSIPTLYRYFTGQLAAQGKTQDAFPRLRLVVLGGEAVYKSDIEKYKNHFSQRCIFINGLGPTESTVTLQFFINRETEITGEAAAVGFPVPETTVYLLDQGRRETVVNAIGELVYKSDYLALGYLNNPEKTHDVFIPDPITREGRVYCSGDLGRRREDGNIEYAGRKDFQVKIMGYRVELAEIESCFLKHDAVREVAVIAGTGPGENDSHYLCAYIVPHAPLAPFEPQEFRQHLLKTLPAYMMPSYYIKLDSLPHTASGKIDRNALPGLPLSLLSTGIEINAPAQEYSLNSVTGAEVEESIIALWAQIQGIPKAGINIDTNLFESGGNSLNLIMLVSQIYQTYHIEVPMAKVFENPTLREIAKYLKNRTYVEAPVIVLNPSASKSLFCFPPGVGFGIVFKELAAQLSHYTFHAFNYITSAVSADANPISSLLAEYVRIITREQPVGPYILYAYSAGGKLAIETAGALEKNGFIVSDIIFSDCFYYDQARPIDQGEMAAWLDEIGKYLEDLGAGHLREKVLTTARDYTEYSRDLTQLPVVNAKIHLILSEENKDTSLSGCWNPFTTQGTALYQGSGLHMEMLSPGHLEKNAEILREILAQKQ
ncbi:MAG TPA: amino acid adenylation domain-containing protein [Candidatus Deferrimicrobium sp.]|nr:amino acid adenylation domain-containing protein [Candidatus Deferrimicrobium sp.]